MKIGENCAFVAILAALAFAPIQASAQGVQAAQAPSPTRLRAGVNDNLVILTWVDSNAVKGDYLVFRSDVPFDAGSFPSATRLGEIASGVRTYTYAPPDSKPYFYGVFAEAADGSPVQAFLSSQNVTPQGVTPQGVTAGKVAPTPATAQAASEAPASPAAESVPKPSATADQNAPSAPPSPFVAEIAAKAKGDAIVVTYKAAPKSRLVLYRGTAPITSAADLLDATLVAAFTDKDGSFADYPVPGVDYYYALLGEEDLKAGRISIVPAVDTLTAPVHVHAGAVSSGLAETPPASRTPPLPYFLLEDGASGGAIMTEHEGPFPAQPVSPETQKAIASLLAKAPEGKPVMPATRLLPEELSAPSGGEDYALSLIVSDRIAAKDWDAAADQLRKYLSLNRSPRASARAHFYLGEALAFMGSGRDAFFEFLSAREFYPAETKPWIEYVLSTFRDAS